MLFGKFLLEKKLLELPKMQKNYTPEQIADILEAFLLQKLEEILTEEETEIARRARNLPIPIGRRHIQAEYRQATAFETLIGWWHENDKNRLDFILKLLEKELNF